MGNDGRLNFGARANASSTRIVTSPAAYNDGNWHHVVGTVGDSGMMLFVDGVKVGSPCRYPSSCGESTATGASAGTT